MALIGLEAVDRPIAKPLAKAAGPLPGPLQRRRGLAPPERSKPSASEGLESVPSAEDYFYLYVTQNADFFLKL